MRTAMLNLKGKRALIFGVASEDSIAWAIAKQLHAAGATISLGYQQRFKSRILQLVRGGDIPVEFYERCDVTNEEELDNFFDAYNGDIDILVHSIAYANPETFGQPISAYSISGPKAKAWFTGMVHGVVVQITACAPTSSGIGLSTISNATSIWVEVMSSYSTSASASAVSSTGLHITGFEPR